MSEPAVWPGVRPTTLAGLLRARAAERPERTAFTFLADGEVEGARLTYGELDRRAQAVAHTLRESLQPGDRALLLYPPGLDFIAAFFGCLYAGVVAVPAYPPRLNDRVQTRLRAIARDAELRAALTTSALFAAAIDRDGFAARVPELAAVRWIPTDALGGSNLPDIELAEPDPGSIAFLQYTSGSTATPKGVMVTHANLLHNEGMIGEAFRQDEDSVVVGWLPLYHDMGLIGNVLQPLHAGGRCVLMAPVAFLQKPLRWLQAIHRYRGTTSGGPNFAYELCVRRIPPEQREGLDLSCWRVAYNGAEPVRAETLERFAEAFAPCGFRRESFYPCYGLAEATLFVTGGDAGRWPRIESEPHPPGPPLPSPPLPPGEGGTRDRSEIETGKTTFFSPLPVGGGAMGEGPGVRGRLVSCGHGWQGQRIAVADPEAGAELAPGRVGEIWISGPSVARGYWRNPEATEHDFRARLVTGDGPFLRTGDLGFLLGGELYVTGRIKDLIIVRGRNHYPQDLELTAERSHPDLRPGCGAAFSVEAAGEERLVLVQEVERRRRDGLEEVAEAVRRAVAEEHEVQVHEVVLVRVGTVPKTSSGKIQRRLCREQYLHGELTVVGRSAVAQEPAATAGPALVLTRGGLIALDTAERRAVLERFLRERAAAAVGVAASALDPSQPLTGFGLDSLGAVELKAGVEAALGVPLPLADLLEGAGTAEIADLLLPALDQESPEGDLPALRSGGAETGDRPLSYGQKALWFLHRLAPEGGAYNIAVAAKSRSKLDPEALRRALVALAARHDALRSVFPVVGEEPVRRVLEEPAIDFGLEDAADWSEARLAERLGEEAWRPFDLARGPLVRVRVFDRGEDEHVLLLAVHHIAADFWSLAVAARDLAGLYSGETESGPPLPVSYGDYVQWQEEVLAGSRGARLWEYWREALAGVPDLDLPADRPRPPVQTWRGGARTLELPAGFSDGADGVRALAATHGATVFMVLLAVFQAQLGRYAGQEDLAVGSPTFGRGRPELGALAGYFVNPVALRGDLAGDPSWSLFLGRVRRVVLGGLEHGDFPFALLAERLRPVRDPARSPVFQTLFLLQRTRPGDEPGLATFALGESGGRIALGGLQLESLRIEERRAQFDLTLRVAEEAGGRLRASLEYNADLFDGETAERMLGHFRTLLAGAVADPERPLSRLPLLAPAERWQLLVGWNATATGQAEARELRLHQLFEAQAARTPEAEALVAGDARLTYEELNRRANQLARHLQALGVGPEVRVGVRLGRTAELMVSLLAVLKAGGAYVPLDPKYPQERLELMLADSAARVVLGEDLLARERTAIDARDGSNLPPPALPANLAYLIYTSGSTGRPKAVAIEHRSPVALVRWARSVFSPEELSGVLASTSIAFDLSVFEIFVPLSWGGRVILAENALELPRLPAAGEVTLVNTVPSAMAELVRGGLPSSLRTVNLAGEPIPPSLVDAIYGVPGVERLYNLYGPSEDTTYSTFTLLAAGQPVSIGRPLDDTRAFVLDAALEPLPVGIPGELLLGGAGLARGYLGRPELTAERFVPDPFPVERGARLYRTGDLVRRRPDGDLDFLGRIDHQVKIRGFRIELGEIEAALSRHPAVREVAVLALPERSGDGRRLAAYVALREGEEVQALQPLRTTELRVFLQDRLPDAFVPTAWAVLPALPLSPNGKVDRKALARIEPRTELEAEATAAAAGAAGEPRNPVEEALTGIMAEVLGLPRVGIHDDFFALGGHSLLAARLLARVSRAFGVELPVSALFQAPTVAALAGKLVAASFADTAAGIAGVPPIRPVLRPHEQCEDLPLSFAQQRLWFLDQLQPGGAAYNMPGAVLLEGPLAVPALAASLAALIRRHEVLRTRFEHHGGRPVQVVGPAQPWTALPVADLADLPEPLRDEAARSLAREEAARPFDLHHGPLLRAGLLRLGAERHLLLLTLHHIVADGWSLGVLMGDLAALYLPPGAGGVRGLPELPVQYADYAVWQREQLSGGVLALQLAWWKERLAGAPASLELPADHPRPSMRTQRGFQVHTRVPAALAGGLRDLARQRGATLFMGLLAAFQTLLLRLTGQEDLLVGSVVANRSRPEVEGLIGFFANTLVLRAELAGDPSFAEALAQARERTLGAYVRQDVPVEKLVEELLPEREMGQTPLFQVMIVLQNVPAPMGLPGLNLRRVPVETATAKFDLTLELTDGEEGLSAVWELSRDLFDPETGRRMAGWFETLLRGAVAEPDQRLSDLPFLGEEERRQSGRIDRQVKVRGFRLGSGGRAARHGYAPPRNPIEELLAGVWAEVLGVERVGIHDGFFALGGHSLLATRAVSRIVETLGVELSLSRFFEAPTVAALAAKLSSARPVAELPPLSQMAQTPRDEPLPLSFAQQRLWFLDRLAPGGAAYNLAAAALLAGRLDAAALERSLDEIVRRHEALRTVFAEIGGRPVQIVRPAEPAGLARLDLSGLAGPPDIERLPRAREAAAQEAARPFDLAAGPVVRFLLVRLGDREHLLVATFHHIAADGWSLQVFLRELSALYGAFTAGLPSPLPDLPVQYADYAVWQRRALGGSALAQPLAFWRWRLAGAEPLELPGDLPGHLPGNGPGGVSARSGSPARTLRLDLPPALAEKVAGRAREAGATSFMVLLAGFSALLSRCTGRTDLTLGAPVAARDRTEVEGLIGFFANTLPLRADLGGDPDFRELLERVRAMVLEAHGYAEVPFERIVEELQPERAAGRNPFFDVLLAYMSAPPAAIEIPGLDLTPVDLPGAESKVGLAWTVHEREGGLAGTLEARAGLFSEAALARLAEHLRTLLDGALAAPGRRLSELPLLGAAERAQLLEQGQVEISEITAGPGSCLHELFEERTRLAPQAPAILFGAEEISYGELAARAHRLARHLLALDLRNEAPVGVLLERSPDLVAALLAVLAAGGVYVPLDPSWPRERLELLLADCGAAALVSRAPLLDRLDPLDLHGAAPVLLDADADALRAQSAEAPDLAVDPRSLAYLIYTSGSTGRPKPVGIEHAAAAAHCETVRRVYGLTPEDRVLGFASIGFDVSLEQILPGLAAGAAIVLRGEDLWEPRDLARRIGELGLTVVNPPLAYWRRWLREGEDLEAAGPGLRLMIAGAEAMPAEAVDLWHRSPLAGIRLLNAYGPTEAVITATVREVAAGDGDPAVPVVPIGRPLPGRSVYVLDRYGSLLPMGSPGELALGGVLARGYPGSPALTAERFVPDPFAAQPGERLYRTGDLGRWRADGGLDFLGRVDCQVKIRGFRVETGEVESCLRAHPEVVDAVVVAVRDGGTAAGLAAFFVAVPTLQVSALRDHLRRSLPEHMVPARFHRLATLPLSPTGKLDRRALERLALSADLPADRDEASAAPQTPVQELLAGIWSELLGVSHLGVDDSFFDLGGHSLLATQLVARVRAVIGVEVPLSDLFAAPTLGGMAERVEAARRAAQTAAAPSPPSQLPLVRRTRPEADAELSFAQQRLWFLQQLEPESAAYHVPGALRLTGPLRPDVLAAALGEIVRRHEALRTVFVDTEAGPRQRALPWAGFPVPFVDLGDLAGIPGGVPGAGAEAERLGLAAALRTFNLRTGPLLRALLLRLAGEEHLLVVVMHHIVSDGWSLGVMMSELAALYGAFAAGAPSPLPELALQYADYATWQRSTLHGRALEGPLAWWRAQLADPPVLDLPADHPRPPVPSGRGGWLPVALPAGLPRGLVDLGRGEGATLFMALLAGFAALLHRYSGQDDLTVGSPIASRNHQEIEPLIGCFVNTLPLRVRLAGDPTVRELLARVREVTLGAYDHQRVPFEKLVEELAMERDRAHSPLFQVMLVLQNAPQPPLRLGDVILSRSELPTGTAKFDLTLALAEEADEIAGVLEHNADLFETATAVRLLGHLAELLAGAVDDPGRRISDLPLLTAAERAQLLTGWEVSGRAAGPRLDDLIAAQAARTPDAPAVVGWKDGREVRFAYADLLARADRLADHLAALGAGPEARVGVCLERTPDLPVALLGVLRAGAAYVPLDPAYPQERLEFMLGDSGAGILVTQRSLDGRCGPFNGEVVWLDEPSPPAPLPSALPAPGRGGKAGNLAYLIYTSGSTGMPKAVAIEHKSAVAMVQWAHNAFSAEELAGVLFSTSVCFDLSVFELFVPLARGGKIIVASNALELPGLAVAGEVTLVNTVPSAMAELARGEGFPTSVRTVNLAGEPLKGALVDEVYALPGVRRVVNLYGPSEDTTYSTWATIPPAPERRGEPGIGRPIADTRVHLLDRAGQLVPEGVPGELLLGGAGLARGYLGRSALTAERFVPDPFGKDGDRLYRTGDLARWRSGGQLEYLGRLDHQVKVRGFRIELGEIEAALARHPEVAEAVVLARDEAAGGKALAAYLVPRAGGVLHPPELRPFLRRSLPEHMVPSAFVELAALPLTANGKVDRRALSRLRLDAAPSAEPAAPRTPTEELLAALWCEVLGRESVGVHDSFFELGGHSLLATRLVSRVRATFGCDVPLARLFDAPTVAELARAVDEARTGGAPQAAPIRPVSRAAFGGDLPLSFAQERLWFLDRMQPGAPYSIPLVMRLRGPLDTAAFGAAFGSIVARHEALRTVFPDRDGEPLQRVLPPAEPSAWPLPVVDLAGLPAPEAPEDTETEGRALAARDALLPFDLAAGPLLRTTLVRLGAHEHLLLLNMHHIVSDGWSLGVLLHELASFYGSAPALPPLPVQYADYAVWQREWLSGEELECQLGFWRRQLAGSSAVLELPADRPRPLVQTSHGASRPVHLPAGLISRLAALGRRQGLTPFMLLLSGWAALLHRHSGQADLSVGTPIAGRNRSEIEPLIGFFVNTLVLRADLSGAPAFTDFAARMRQVALAAYDHQDLPLEKLVDELKPERDLSRQPLFQVLFALQNAPLGEMALPGGLALEPVEPAAVAAKFDLTLNLREAGGEVVGSLEHNTDLFDATTAARLAAQLAVLLAAVADDPAQPVAELPVLTAGERQQLLVEWSATPAGAAVDVPVHRLFEAQAARAPERIAFVFGARQVSYGEVNARANRLARRLRGLGVGCESRVGVALERSPEMVIAFLAALKAGGAYVPLDVSFPRERLAEMVAEAGVELVVDGELLDRESAAVAAQSPRDLPGPDLGGIGDTGGFGGMAYVMFTSGSTGRPKAVAVEHRGIVRLVRGASYADLGPEQVFLQLATASFDASTLEIWGVLLHGARLAFLPTALPSFDDLDEVLARHGVSILFITTGLFHQIVENRIDLLRGVRQVLTGGEVISPQAVDRVLAQLPGCRLIACYGPTENTTFTTCVDVREPIPAGRSVSLGRPIAGTSVHVLDRGFQPAPAGAPGELCTGGDGLARGYLGRPELHGRALGAQPVGGRRRRARGARVPHRRPGALAARRRAGVPRAARPPGQDPRFPDRAGGGRGGARASPRAGRGGRPGARRGGGRQAARRLRGPAGGCRPGRRRARRAAPVPPGDAAGVHGAFPVRRAAGPAAHAERQGRPPRAGGRGARAAPRTQDVRRSFQRPGGGHRPRLARGLRPGRRPRRPRDRRQLLRLGRQLAAPGQAAQPAGEGPGPQLPAGRAVQASDHPHAGGEPGGRGARAALPGEGTCPHRHPPRVAAADAAAPRAAPWPEEPRERTMRTLRSAS